MGQNPYPVELQAGDDKGPVIYAGDLTFKDPSNQPGGGFTAVTVTDADSPFTAEAGQLLVCENETGTMTITLPETPAPGSQVAVWGAEVADGIVIGSDEGIDGEDTVTLTDEFAVLVVAYSGPDRGWATLAQGVPGAGGGGLPTAWTINDPDDGDLNANGGTLLMNGGPIDLGGGEIENVNQVLTNTVLSSQGLTSALSTATFVSGVGNNPMASDGCLYVPFTSDGSSNDATLEIELSPDGTTYSAVGTVSVAAGINTVGAVTLVQSIWIPGLWFVRLTAVHGTIGTATFTGLAT